jgi:hypothetical protein
MKLEVELNRMVERMRHMGGTATSVETIGTIGDTIKVADEVDVSQANKVREMTFTTRSLLAGLPEVTTCVPRQAGFP